MVRLITSIFVLTFLLSFNANAQEQCLTEILFREEAAKNPDLLKQREQYEEYMRDFISRMPTQRTASGVVRIIPVVVHVIHYGGAENISDEQIQNGLDVINRDFRRLNADTVDTPAPFKPLGTDAEIEFQLAKLDPNGNCTNGIVRVYNSMTYNARNNVKALSYWDRSMYLNMWIVSSIQNTSGVNGIVAGFAQFPGMGSAATDGVVIRNDYFGDIGTSNPARSGRTVTHEVGHWLGLYHIWGDDAGACSGTDYVSDTPNQADWTFSVCPTFPRTDICSAVSPGIMYSNYMDYTNGDCQNIFTQGQVNRFNSTLAGAAGQRNNLTTTANYTLTGITGGPAACAPIADFLPATEYVCEGNSVTFQDISWNGDVTSRQWTFAGGTPATDTSANPVITYNTPGTYDVTLTVTNSVGSNTITRTGRVVVSPLAVTNTVPWNEGFESSAVFPYQDWGIHNGNGITSNTWEVTNIVSSVGSNCIMLDNSTNNDKGYDEFITSPINLSNVISTQMTFDYAFAPSRITPAPADKLTIYYSSDCGKTWSARANYSSSQLTTIGTDSISGSYFPDPSEWLTKTVNMAMTTISTRPNMRFKFQFNHDSGSNLFIDNININGTVVSSVNELNAGGANVNVYPNPSSSNTYVDFTMVSAGKVIISVLDLSGRIIDQYTTEKTAGDHQYTIPAGLDQGAYMVRLAFGEYSVTKQLIIR